MPLPRPTLAQLIAQSRQDILTRMPGADAQLPVAFLGILPIVLGGAFHAQYGAIAYLARQIFADTAEKANLERLAGVYGVRRKQATPAQFGVTVQGAAETPLAAGTALNRSDTAVFTTNIAVTLTGAPMTVPVTAAVAGSAGNTPAGATLQFGTGLANVNTSVTVGAPIAIGNDPESDAGLLARYLFRVQNPPQGGCETDYEAWLLGLTGITRPFVYPRQFGVGTVGLSFVCNDRADIFPLAADIEAARQALRKLRPVTAETVLYAPIPAPINPYVHIAPDTPATRAAVTAEMNDFVLRTAAPGVTILRSQLERAVEDAAGIQDCQLVAPNINVTNTLPFMATLGQVSFL